MTDKLSSEILLKMSETDRVKALELLTVIEKRKTQEAAKSSFIEFVKQVWEDFIPGPHHKRMANAFERVQRGELKRLIINLAPRHTKSEFASYLLPAWWLGHNPKDQIMQISHTAELAEGFGRKVRNLVSSNEYANIFPNTQLSRDSTAAARWNTSVGGKYVAMGVGGAVAGLGASLCLDKNSRVIVRTLGNAPLGCVEVGDEIKTVYGWERVTNKVLTTHNKHYRINGDLKASGEHPFLTRRGWVQAKDLQVGDKILIDSIWRKLCRTIKTTLRLILPANHG